MRCCTDHQRGGSARGRVLVSLVLHSCRPDHTIIPGSLLDEKGTSYQKAVVRNQTDDVNRSDMDMVTLPDGRTYVVWGTHLSPFPFLAEWGGGCLRCCVRFVRTPPHDRGPLRLGCCRALSCGNKERGVPRTAERGEHALNPV